MPGTQWGSGRVGVPVPGYACGDIAVYSALSMYQTKAVLIAMLITAIVAIIVTIFCFQTKVRRGCALGWGWRHGSALL